MKRIGIIAGNRNLPLLLARVLKERGYYVVAIGFFRETSSKINKLADKTYWLKVGELKKLADTVGKEGINSWVLAGQISPLNVFRKKNWDEDCLKLIETVPDLRPHSVFGAIIDYLQKKARIEFKSALSFLSSYTLSGKESFKWADFSDLKKEIDFGLKIVSKYVELDVGQTLGVKNKMVVALESAEGTDNTIKRAGKVAGEGVVIFKFSKSNQDLRFDFPVVGLSTLKLLRKIKAKALVLEEAKVVILEKKNFLKLASYFKIPVIATPLYSAF